VTLRDGRKVNHFTRHPPGTKENPLSADAVNAKVRGLLMPVLGAQRSEDVIRRVHTIEQTANVRDLVALMTGPA
jgi:hypothetical protein